MWDIDGMACLLVVKCGNATGITLGHGNGIFSIVCQYNHDMSLHQTSMKWAILNYNSKSEVFSLPGNLSSMIANINGHINGMLTGSSGKTQSSEITYATSF
jgi:hypothetical protein